ncbi:sugar porter family MFS transporter [Pseudoclavibacter sp. 13-3]|uniref:sugar porter family MFS transporter n=1 Tax=Pseudoclavibacter sp. 13-3 TaxID=2901228 RepID=UPI0022B23C0A|nr:sugar porter family MFS transporter [Pseudoclavibacter sp. 13-3]
MTSSRGSATESDRMPDGSPDRRVTTIVLIATMGAVAFGYDTGVLAGALPFLSQPRDAGGLGLDALAEGIVTSALVFAASLGALVGGRLADRLGRRRTLIFVSLVFAGGALGTGFAPSVESLVACRVVLGLAVGASSTIVPVFIGEIAPARRRAGLVTRNQLMIVTGQLLAAVANAAIARVSSDGEAWRHMLLVSATPALLLFVGLWFVPESPRWLAMHGRSAAARRVLGLIRTPGEGEHELQSVAALHERANETAGATDGTDRHPLRARWVRRLVLIGAGLGMVSQLTGVNSVMYFAPSILATSGLGTQAALTATIATGVISVLATLVGIRVLRRLGRRPIMITGLIGVASSHLLLGLAFALPVGPAQPWLVLTLMLVLLCFVQAMVSVVFWLMTAELFPLRVRGMAAGVAVCVQWVTNGVVALLFPVAFAHLGGDVYFVFAAVNVLSAWFVWRALPETRGLALEEVEGMLRRRLG